MLFNVPVVFDADLARTLNDHVTSIHSCHFSLHAPHVHDGRVQRSFLNTERWTAFLADLKIPRKYLLMNSRVHDHSAYFEKEALKRVLSTLDAMFDAGALHGIVFTDAYYLQALSDAGPETAARLEAVPGINHMLDSYERVASLMDFIESTHFALPGAIILDRSLNRRLEVLAEITSRCRNTYPGVKIELLANEGCLDHCPFKLTHDCHISMVNLGMTLDTHVINRRLGCIRALQRSPALLFKSPFIRPEDAAAYEPMVDVLKICGRTLGAPFLTKVLDAYLKGRFCGNLIELLDAMEPAAQWLHVDNASLPHDFLRQLSRCSRECRSCTTCRDLLRKFAGPKEFTLPRA